MTRACFLMVALLALCNATLSAQDSDDPPVPWYERLQFSGDFRSRYEGFYQDREDTRHRARLRLRLRLDAGITDDVRLHLQLASGDPGTPVSTNQTFTGFFTPKPINLDRAFIEYTPAQAPALTLGLGKFNAPQPATQMVFDDDLNFEGGWQEVSWEAGGVDLSLGAIQTTVNEVSAGSDAFMLGGFGVARVAAGAHEFRVSAANYGWGRADQIAIASADGPLESILTNVTTHLPDGSVAGFASRFNVVDIVGEATFATGRPEFPIRLLAEAARNTRAANNRNSGIWFEAEYGRARTAGTWSTGYTYGRVEQDLTPSAFVFSDMPGTNVRLHMLEGSYVPKAGLSLDATLHLTQTLAPADPALPNGWLARLHLAAVVRF